MQPALSDTHVIPSLHHAGVLYVVDQALKKAMIAAGIAFPAPLVGMFIVTALMLVIGESAAAKCLKFFGPTLNWIAKWLPLFYVASLVTLPLALKGIAGGCGCVWVCGCGWLWVVLVVLH